MQLGSSQKAVVEWLKGSGKVTAKDVGLALYDEVSSCAGPGVFAADSIKTSWARKILNNLVKKGIVSKDVEAGTFEFIELSAEIKLPLAIVREIERMVKTILHAGRDCYRNQGKDTMQMAFETHCGYYGEAFGMLRALHILGICVEGASNLPKGRHNYVWWFEQLKRQVLEEENFPGYGDGSGRCDHCLKKYGKDAAGRRRSDRKDES
jgi:hypothetical protein